ncbi:MAG: hypothetical protein AAGC81_02210 [Pseudomonadota bacterium]
MQFAKAVRQEIRNEFGPAAASSATRIFVIVAGIAIVIAIGSEAISFAGILGDAIKSVSVQ